MKKIYVLALLLTIFYASSKAQLRVVDNGRVEIACSDNDTNDSRFAVGGGQSGFAASFKGNSLNSSGLYAEAGVPTNNSWMIGVKGSSYMYDNNLYKVGVYGYALQGANLGIGRSFGVYGVAGNATAGWNYGVCGIISGNSRGAGVFGTIDNQIVGVDGKYAGYFKGRTKVQGSLTVTGGIDGMLISESVESSMEYLPNESFSSRLGALQATSYFYPVAESVCEVQNEADSIETMTSESSLESQIKERVHYGFKTEQLKEVFPELVYTKEDGTVGVNYIELIPMLVQTINELNQRINILEGKGDKNVPTADLLRAGNESFTVQRASASIETTAIYRLPSNSKSAEILVCDLSGQVKKVVNIPEGKSGSVTFRTDGLENGVYMYSLIVDGEVCATKRMLVKH